MRKRKGQGGVGEKKRKKREKRKEEKTIAAALPLPFFFFFDVEVEKVLQEKKNQTTNLAEDEVVGAEDLAVGPRAHRVHGAGLEVEEHGARDVAAWKRVF